MKKLKKALMILILVAIVGTITFFIGRQIGLNEDTSTTTTTVENVAVSKQTITKTLTTSGQIQSANTEKLDLSTTYYYDSVCVEEDDTLDAGANILKYTNGTYLTAPYNLVVSSLNLPDSNEIATTSNYVEVQDLDNLKISISVTESEIASIAVGQEVTITLNANTSKTYTGTIEKIDSVGTYSSSGTTFNADVSFVNDGTAKIGMSVSCTINIEEKTDVIAVPIEAVQIEDDRRYVIVVDDNGQTTEVNVTTGISNDEYVEILSGLDETKTVQVTTTTKESTLRSSSSSTSDGRSDNGGSFGGMEMSDSDRGSMKMQGGDMAMGGDMPSMP